MENVITLTDGKKMVAVDADTVHQFCIKELWDNYWSICIWQQQGRTAFAMSNKDAVQKLQSFIINGTPYIHNEDMPFEVEFSM